MTVMVNRRADFTLDSFRRVAFGREAVETPRRPHVRWPPPGAGSYPADPTGRRSSAASLPAPGSRSRRRCRRSNSVSTRACSDGVGIVWRRLPRGQVIRAWSSPGWWIRRGSREGPPRVRRRVAAPRAPRPVPLNGQEALRGAADAVPRADQGPEFEEGEGMALVNGGPYPPRSWPTPRCGPTPARPGRGPLRARPTPSGRRSGPTTRRWTTSGRTAPGRGAPRARAYLVSADPRAASAIRRRWASGSCRGCSVRRRAVAEAECAAAALTRSR
jgi:hypothetical protein